MRRRGIRPHARISHLGEPRKDEAISPIICTLTTYHIQRAGYRSYRAYLSYLNYLNYNNYNNDDSYNNYYSYKGETSLAKVWYANNIDLKSSLRKANGRAGLRPALRNQSSGFAEMF